MKRIAELLVAVVLGALVAVAVEHAGALGRGMTLTRVEVASDVPWTASTGPMNIKADSRGEFSLPKVTEGTGRREFSLTHGNVLSVMFSGREDHTRVGGQDALAQYPAHVALRVRGPWSSRGPWVTIEADAGARAMVSDSLFALD